jgi:hypothetical protein
MFEPKKIFMIHFWRIQQCQTIISVLFWSATLAGVFFEYLKPWFIKYGIIEQHQVGLGLLIIFLMVLGLISLFGYIYDVFLKLWIEANIVGVERDIYARTKQFAKEIVQWQTYYIPLLRALDRKHEADFFEKWNERCMEEDPRLRRDVLAIVRWVNSYQMKSEKERWLKDIRKEFWANLDDKEFKKFEKEVSST